MGIPPYFKEFCDASKGTIDEKECFTDGSSSTSRWRTLGDHFQWCTARLRVRSILVFPFREQPRRCPWSTDIALRKKWWLTGHRTYVFTIPLLQHETGRRNGPCESILLLKWTLNKACLHRSFEIRFHSIKWGISVPTPRIWHAKCRGRCQPFGANTKISYKVGNWHSSPSLRKENTAAEPHFLKRRRLHAFTFRIFTGLLNLNPKLLPHPNSPSPEKRRGLFGEDY